MDSKSEKEEKPTRSVLSSKCAGGPHGLGDPNDRTLRKVETEILIPMKMRDIANKDKCSEYVQKFSNCGKENGIFVVLKCRKENKELKECLKNWFYNENFRKECTEIYLKERSEYRLEGKEAKIKRKESVMF